MFASRHIHALFMLAVECAENERFDLAERAATRMIELDPSDAEAYQQRAAARVKLHKYDEALADCDAALRLDPRDENTFRVRGAAHVGLHRYDEAVADLDRAIGKLHEDPEAFYLRGAGPGGTRQDAAGRRRSVLVDCASTPSSPTRTSSAQKPTGNSARPRRPRPTWKRRCNSIRKWGNGCAAADGENRNFRRYGYTRMNRIRLIITFRGINVPTSELCGKQACGITVARIVDGRPQRCEQVAFAYQSGIIWEASVNVAERGQLRLEVIDPYA